MSAGNLFTKEKTDSVLRNGSKHKGDDDATRGGGGGDPAVLAMGPVRNHLVYTREQLMRLRESPLVKEGLETAFVGVEALALVLKKRPDSPHDDERGAKGDGSNDHKGYGGGRSERRTADPRERVRKEGSPSGGIVLSPQRRSFTSGCGAPANAPAPQHPPHLAARTRPESPLSKAEARRVGSGRLMMRDITAVPWEREDNDRDFRGTNREREERTIPRNSDRDIERDNFRATNREREERSIPRDRDIERDNFRGTNREREERSIPRNNDREIERDNFKGTNREREERMIPRNNDRDIERDNFRATNREREERSIPRNSDSRYERRSFTRDSFGSDVKRERDDRFCSDKNNRDDRRSSGNRYGQQRRYDKEEEPEWFSGGPTSQLETIELRGFDEPPKRNGSVSSTKQNNEKWSTGSKTPPLEKWRASPHKSPAPASPAPEPTPSEPEEKVPEEPPQNAPDQAEFNLDDFLKFDAVPDILTNGTTEEGGGSRFSRWFQRSETPTHDYERYLNNLVDDLDNCSIPQSSNVFTPIAPAEPTLLDLLRRANNNDTPDHLNTSAGKMHNLHEVEAGFRPPPMPHNPDHDMSAFKRLLAQVSGGHAVPAEPRHPPPMSLLQMLNKSMEQKPPQPPQPQPPHIPQDLLYKLLHVQRQQEMGNAPPTMPMQPQDRELLQRPEATALIQGLKSGEITAAHLIQQLNNPALQSRHRELLQAVLRMHHNHQIGGSPLPYGPPPHLAAPHHQQLRLSPLPHQGVPPRIPSPRELVAHTQTIMQNALIKRKLEEQKENYRRRTEQKQPPHMAFTPTSVLRKMTAEKESEQLSPKPHQWNQPQKMPQGRPIVKGNQSGMSAGMNYPSHPSEYHFLQQQQMASGRQFPHPQQRQPPVMNNINNMNNLNMGRGPPINNSLQQLIVQTHQRTMNEMGIGSAGGDNQLSRWFSPELLAQASAGKLPSVHVPNALALEDLERSHHSPAVRN